MSQPLIVSDASPIIAFHDINELRLLERLVGSVVVPPEVVREIEPSVGQLPHWIVERPLSLRLPSLGPPTIDAGEREVIGLALELDADLVILDERDARSHAKRQGLRVVGACGLVIRAKRAGIVPAARPVIDALIEAGLYVGSTLYGELLALADESGDEGA